MIKNRLLYLAVAVGCLVFFVAYREWFSWFALMWVLAMPVLSLIISLPAMLTVAVQPDCPLRLEIGQTTRLCIRSKSWLPTPVIKGKYRIHNRLTGEVWTLKTGKKLPTEHCGFLAIQPVRIWVCDYMGLWQLPVWRKGQLNVLILPKEVPMEEPPALNKRPMRLWRPKPGGGFSENHDLREYRPGDSLRLIHWKLASKTKKLIYREPVEALRDKAVVSVSLAGSPEQLNDKLGSLLWLSRYLLEKEMPHELRCATGGGEYDFPVTNGESLDVAMFNLLQLPASDMAAMPQTEDAYWHHHIGGGIR